MAAPPPRMSGNVPTDFTSMSMGQIYDLVAQMKIIVDEDRNRAKEVLMENPLLTKHIFRAQLILDMVKPTPEEPKILQAVSQPQPASAAQLSSDPGSPSLPIQAEELVQAGSSQPLVPSRQQNVIQTSVPVPSASIPSLSYQAQTFSANALQPLKQAKGYMNVHIPSVSLPQTSQIPGLSKIHWPSQIPNLPLPPLSAKHFSVPPPNTHMDSSQVQQILHTSVAPHYPLQPPLPQQPRPTLLPPFPHQIHPQAPHNTGVQHQSASQQFPSHSAFHSGGNPNFFPLGQPPLPSHPPPHQLYQGGGLHMGPDYVQGPPLQAERVPSWVPGPIDKSAVGPQFPGPLPSIHGQMHAGPSSHIRPSPLTPEMEKALLQQVMNLTPEQINFLPPDQRTQVIKLQEMLR